MGKAQRKRTTSPPSVSVAAPRLRILPWKPPNPSVLASAFIDARGIPADVAPFVHLVIEVASEFLASEARAGHWAALSPDRFVLHWRSRAPLPRDMADLQLLALASFYRWLGEHGHVPVSDGAALAWALLAVP